VNAKDLFGICENLFGKRTGLISMLQDVAENFYPERADFTAQRAIGEEFGAGLMSSYPLLVRRDLGNAFETMLRPMGQTWFHMGVEDEDSRADNESRRWMEDKRDIMRRAMFDRVTQFGRATKEGDHDFATFGQAVLQVEKVTDNQRVGPHLLYRCWHLRDVAWMENRYGQLCPIFRKWKPGARDLTIQFPQRSEAWRKGVHAQVVKDAAKDPFGSVDVRHMVVEADMYDGDFMGKKAGVPYVSIFYDVKHDHVMEAVGKWSKEYVIPRWQTVSGSQYAHSPAVVAGLPEARLLQAMTRTLLEAGEKAVNPPMIGVQDAIRSDIQIFAGGFTAVDAEYDERLGEVLRPLVQDKSGIPLGIDMQRDARTILAECFFLSKLNLPQTGKEMTAYEVGQRVQEYIRNAMPLFGPMEVEYNGALCEETFEQMFGGMLRMEARGIRTPLDIPRRLRGANIQFRFESPLHDAIEKQKLGKFMEGKAVLAEAIALDPSLAALPDTKVCVRDVLTAIWPATWIRSETEVQEIEAAAAQQEQAQALLANLQAGADVAKTGSEAVKNFSEVPA
jgi:hypothetical protein